MRPMAKLGFRIKLRNSCEVVLQTNVGTPGKIRTCDPLIRSQILYPAELRVHANLILDSAGQICKYLDSALESG